MNIGFFSKEELPALTQKEQITDGTECYTCGLFKRCKSPKMPISGNGHKKILIIFEAPTVIEDAKGRTSTEKSNRLLINTFKKVGIDIKNDCWKTYAIKCKVTKKNGEHREPTLQDVQFCHNNLENTIKKLKPTVIITLGKFALASILLDRFNKVKVNTFRGLIIPDRKYNAWLLPIFHPSDIYKQKSQSDNLLNLWKRDAIQVAKFALSVQPLENKIDPYKSIKILTDFHKIIFQLKEVLKKEPKYFYFDYETTGLKPDAPGHKIPYISFCTDEEISYSFPFQHKDFFEKKEQKEIKKLFITILKNKKIIKLAHNFKFELIWSEIILDTYPEPWGMDAMLASHIWDNRSSFTGLKLQSFILFGITPYDKEIKRYLEAPTNNSFNKVEQIPYKKALIYNALDSLLGFWTFKHYYKLLNKPENTGLLNAYNHFHKGTLVFSDMQNTGICADEKYYEKKKIELSEEINTLTKELSNSKESRTFQKKYGRQVDINSPKELSELLYDMLKYFAEENEKGNKSVDKEALEKINSPFVKKIIKVRQLNKIVGTYINQFQNEVVNGVIHPMFGLNIPVSYRSSSQGPNFQNIPIKEALAKKVCRGGLIPSKGNKILEADYSGIEVKIAACVTKDPNLIKYVTNPITDMHRDSASDIWLLDQNKVTKEMRQSTKSDWVFPQFYGSYYGHCGENAWNTCIGGKYKLKDGTSLLEHIKKNGIKNKKQFINHCKEVEDTFWNIRFKRYAEWKKEINAIYNKQGWIENLFGFKFKGYMEPNAVTNYPIQSCLQGDSKVLTNNGWIPIKELVNFHTKIWTGFKWAEAIGLFMSIEQLATITLSSGIKINCDIKHKLKNEKHEWISFKKLKINDYVALPKMYEYLKPSKKMTIEFIIGFIIGDGYLRLQKVKNYYRKYVNITVGKTKLPDLKKILKFLIQKNIKGYKPLQIKILKIPNYADQYSLIIEDKKFTKLLEQKGIIFGSIAKTKKIPKNIWTATLQQQRDFLEGIFLSDGNRGHEQKYNLHMCNYKLLTEIQILSSSLGFDTKLTKITTGWLLRNSIKGKNKKPVRKIPYETIANKINVSDIPWKSNEQIVERRVIKKQQDISQYIGERIIDKYAINKEIYRYDKIIDIQIHDKKEETFTMSVNDPLHQFIADGVVHKNCAFHCLLWSLINIQEIADKENWKTLILGQVHDSIVLDTHPIEEKHIIKIINKIGTTELQNTFDWIIVPMEIEFENTEIDQPWSMKKDLII